MSVGRPVTSHSASAQARRCRSVRGPAKDQLCARHAEDGIAEQARDWDHVHTETGNDPWSDFVSLCRSCHVRYDQDTRWRDPVYRAKVSSAISDRMKKRWADPDMRQKMLMQPRGAMGPEARRKLSERSIGNRYAAGLERDERGRFT